MELVGDEGVEKQVALTHPCLFRESRIEDDAPRTLKESAAHGAMEGGFRGVKWTGSEMAGGRGDRLEVLTGRARRRRKSGRGRAMAALSGIARTGRTGRLKRGVTFAVSKQTERHDGGPQGRFCGGFRGKERLGAKFFLFLCGSHPYGVFVKTFFIRTFAGVSRKRPGGFE